MTNPTCVGFSFNEDACNEPPVNINTHGFVSIEFSNSTSDTRYALLKPTEQSPI